MKRLLPLAAALAAAALSLAVVPASAADGQSAAAGPPLHVISLRAAFARALPRVTTGPEAGVVPPRGNRLRAASSGRAPASCTEPNCDLSYGGGAVQSSPHVYLLLWGPDWTTSSPAYDDLYYLYDGLGVTSHDTWSTVTSQYGPAFSGTVLAGAWQDSSAPPNPVTEADLAAEADGFASTQGITDLADAQIVIASESGTCFSDGFVGSCGVANPNGAYCGWHSYSGTVSYTNLPYQTDAGPYCGENWINSGAAGTYDGFSTVAGHEYAESATDPDPNTGWTDPGDTISGGGAPAEVADKCIWGGSVWGPLGSDPYGDVKLSTGTFAMQSLWSNAARRCVLTSGPAITASTPGTQTSTLGTSVSVQVRASTNTGTALTYKASGLPAGLSIGRTSGKIAGKPAVTAGTFRTAVRVSDYAGSATVTFGWRVSSKAGPVKGYDSKCADDYRDRNSDGTKIDLWSCDGQARQRITFAASGELQLAGKCITAGNGAVLERCTGSAAQTWTRRANGDYAVKSTGRCLTDPAKSKKNGTQLRLEPCAATPGQSWSLP